MSRVGHGRKGASLCLANLCSVSALFITFLGIVDDVPDLEVVKTELCLGSSGWSFRVDLEQLGERSDIPKRVTHGVACTADCDRNKDARRIKNVGEVGDLQWYEYSLGPFGESLEGIFLSTLKSASCVHLLEMSKMADCSRVSNGRREVTRRSKTRERR